jgi:DNA-binding MarR family transcriptional regulator
MPKSATELIPLVIADVYQLAGSFRRRGEEIARAVGQTQARWQVLSAASGSSRTVPQLARTLGVTRQNVQRIIDTLVDERLARFVDNPDHKTSPHVELTDGGRRLLARLTRAASSRHSALGALAKGVDLGRLRQDLRVLQAALDTQSSTEAWPS